MSIIQEVIERVEHYQRYNLGALPNEINLTLEEYGELITEARSIGTGGRLVIQHRGEGYASPARFMGIPIKIEFKQFYDGVRFIDEVLSGE